MYFWLSGLKNRQTMAEKDRLAEKDRPCLSFCINMSLRAHLNSC